MFGKGACSFLAEFGLQVRCWWETSWQEILMPVLEDVLGWFTEAKAAIKQRKNSTQSKSYAAKVNIYLLLLNVLE